MNKREIVERTEMCRPEPIAFAANADANAVKEALLQAWKHGNALLLAHAHDGVIWGRVRGGDIKTANQAGLSEVALNVATLQQVRVFNDDEELFVWRDGDGWKARTIYTVDRNTDATYTHALDEDHWLYGTRMEESGPGFSLLAHEAQGLRHAVPMDSNVSFPVTLKVRHLYRKDDDTGALMLAASRLVGLSTVKES